MFKVLIADCPWSFDRASTGGSSKSGAAQKYPVMSLGEIMALPVQAIMDTPSVCFLWVPTALKFSHGGQVLAAWGYGYKTTVYWNKQNLGLGHWFRNSVEELLVGLRGDYPPFGCQLPNIINLPPGEHSAKPDEFHRLIETATGVISSRYNVELFARKLQPGWTGLGNQVTGRTIQGDLARLAIIRRCRSWQPGRTNLAIGGVMRCACSGTLEEHHQAVIDAISTGTAV